MKDRIICLDIGDARIGVAVSDPTGTIASPLSVIQRIGWGPDIAKITSLCHQYSTNKVLSGLPLNMDGTEGFQAAKVREFCALLDKAGLEVVFQDERLSTVSAEEALLEGDLSRRERKLVVDKVAAAVILQQWLDEQKRKEKERMNDQENRNTPFEEDGMDHELSEGDLIEMIGESGETVTFMFIDALEYEGDIYLALAEPEEDDAVFFLRIEQDESGNDVYSAPDEELEETLFEVFSSKREQDTSEE